MEIKIEKLVALYLDDKDIEAMIKLLDRLKYHKASFSQKEISLINGLLDAVYQVKR